MTSSLVHYLLKQSTFGNATMPGPSKPVNPNGLKPIVLGQQQPQTPGADSTTPSAVLPGSAGSAADPSEVKPEDLQKAQGQAQQAQAQAAQAKAQLQMAQAQAKHMQQMAQQAQGLDRTYVGKSVERLNSHMSQLKAKALRTRMDNLGVLKTANSPAKLTRSGKAWDASKPFSGWNGAPADAGFKKPEPVSGRPMANMGDVTRDDLWNTAKFVATKPSEAYNLALPDALSREWSPMKDGGYDEGSLGSWLAPTVNGVSNFARRSIGNFARLPGQFAQLVSSGTQAADSAIDMARHAWREGLNYKPFQDDAWESMKGHMIDSVEPALNTVAPVATPLFDAAMDQFGAPLMERMFAGTPGQPNAEQAPAPQAPAGDAPNWMDWLAQMTSRIQGGWQNLTGGAQPSYAAIPLQPQAGSGGHNIPNLHRYA